MKIRSDFITNSSSSSFILSFRDENSIEETLRSQFPSDIEVGFSGEDISYLDQVIEECKDESNRYTREEIEDELWDESDYPIWYLLVKDKQSEGMSYSEARDYMNSEDGHQLLQSEVRKKVESILSEIGDDTIIVSISHGDGGDGEDGVLEHQILPYLQCTRAYFSHH